MSDKCAVCGRQTWSGFTAIEGRLSPFNACHRDDSNGVTFSNLECYRLGYERVPANLAAAEERGRRRGVEEADRFRKFLVAIANPRKDVLDLDGDGRARWLMDCARAALAPRDSAAGRGHPADCLCVGCVLDESKAPRDSGKEG